MARVTVVHSRCSSALSWRVRGRWRSDDMGQRAEACALRALPGFAAAGSGFEPNIFLRPDSSDGDCSGFFSVRARCVSGLFAAALRDFGFSAGFACSFTFGAAALGVAALGAGIGTGPIAATGVSDGLAVSVGFAAAGASIDVAAAVG